MRGAPDDWDERLKNRRRKVCARLTEKTSSLNSQFVSRRGPKYDTHHEFEIGFFFFFFLTEKRPSIFFSRKKERKNFSGITAKFFLLNNKKIVRNPYRQKNRTLSSSFIFQKKKTVSSKFDIFLGKNKHVLRVA